METPEKSPEQIAAELKLQSDLKILEQEKAKELEATKARELEAAKAKILEEEKAKEQKAAKAKELEAAKAKILEEEKAKEQKAAKAKELEAKKEKAGELHFVLDGEVYKPIIPRVFIPGLGRRTALEICADEEAQAYLVKENCIGTVIEKL